MNAPIDEEAKESLREALADRHKQTCIQILHGKTNECDCGLDELTGYILQLSDCGDVVIELAKRFDKKQMEK